MSALHTALKTLDANTEHWKPFGQRLISSNDRGILFQDLINSAGEGTTKEKIEQISMNMLELLEWDRHDFTEGWERLQSACYEAKIDLSEKYDREILPTDRELAALTKSVLSLKKIASKAAKLWEKTSLNRSSFSKLDLSQREVYLNQAKSNSSVVGWLDWVCPQIGCRQNPKSNSDFHPWAAKLPKSPEISNFAAWLKRPIAEKII